MIILDTNVLGELVRPQPDRNVIRWVDRQAADELATTAITAAEMALGAAQMDDGKRKAQIIALNAAILGQMAIILPFSAHDAENYARVMDVRRRLGRRIEPLDAQIAAIALSQRAIVATRNTKDFDETGIELINPWIA
jgi:predicted nucleic acid-binding protein